MKVKSLCHVWLFVTPWTVACQAPLSLGFSRQEYWSGLPFPSLGDLPDPGIKPGSPALQADSTIWATREAHIGHIYIYTYQIRSDQSLIRVWLFATPWTAARQASLSITNSQSSPKPMSIESVIKNDLISSIFYPCFLLAVSIVLEILLIHLTVNGCS